MRNLSRLCGLLKLLKIEYDVMTKIHMRHGSPSGTDQTDAAPRYANIRYGLSSTTSAPAGALRGGETPL